MRSSLKPLQILAVNLKNVERNTARRHASSLKLLTIQTGVQTFLRYIKENDPNDQLRGKWGLDKI